MVLLTSLPSDQQVTIFGQWLSLLDINRFDSAACESTGRKQYLQVIKSDQLLLSEFIECTSDNIDQAILDIKEEQCIEWLVLRGIKFSCFGFVARLGENGTLRQRFLEQSGSFIKTIDFWGLESDDDNIYMFTSGQDPLGTASTADVVFDIAHYCPNLENLTMAKYIVDATLVNLFCRCSRLQTIDLQHCYGITNTVLRAICTYGRALKELSLDRCFFHDGSLSFASSPCTSLEQLSAVDSRLSDEESVKLVSLFPNIQVLKLGLLQHDGLFRILNLCPLIDVFHATLDQPLQDAQVHQLAQGWVGMETLELRCSEMNQPVMSEQRPLLQELRLAFANENPLDESANVYEVPVGSSVSHLGTLVLLSASMGLLMEISQLCPYLAHFGIMPLNNQSPSPSNEVFIEFMKRMEIINLELCNCPHITAKSIRELRAMERIVFTDLRHVGDSCLETLAENSPELNTVVLTRCARVTANALLKIAQHCPQLTTMEFESNSEQDDTQLANTIFQQVQLLCPNLKTFVVDGQFFNV